MKPSEYVSAAIRTAATIQRDDWHFVLGGLGLVGESIETFEVLTAPTIDHTKLLKELGDVTWYAALLCHVHYLNFEDLLFSADAVAENARRRPNTTPVYAIHFHGKRLLSAAKDLSEFVKKTVYHGHALDMHKLEMNLAMVVRRVQIIALLVDTSIEEVLQLNIDKLKERYPERFTTELSLNKAAD